MSSSKTQGAKRVAGKKRVAGRVVLASFLALGLAGLSPSTANAAGPTVFPAGPTVLPAGPTIFPADPMSLGPVQDGADQFCDAPSYGPPRDVKFDVKGVSGPLTDVQVHLAFDPPHTFVGDLHVELIAPGAAASKVIFGHTNCEMNGDDVDVAGPYGFADGASDTPSWWQAAAGAAETIPSGFYRASLPNGDPNEGQNTLITPAFSGLADPNGTWTLRIRDGVEGDVGSVFHSALLITDSCPVPFVSLLRGLLNPLGLGAVSQLVCGLGL